MQGKRHRARGREGGRKGGREGREGGREGAERVIKGSEEGRMGEKEGDMALQNLPLTSELTAVSLLPSISLPPAGYSMVPLKPQVMVTGTRPSTLT